ncbi:hypothetical protein CSUI_006428 [Cystoisospora suis]|uniref:Transmembrane protein n=1 Tax=Cystoisospora suis TaxID=483139 RepID=A0A2C6KQC3_9APIC|nr:hypothetical protein CSUI_006428 [Cystoisospora suis]
MCAPRRVTAVSEVGSAAPRSLSESQKTSELCSSFDAEASEVIVGLPLIGRTDEEGAAGVSEMNKWKERVWKGRTKAVWAVLRVVVLAILITVTLVLVKNVTDPVGPAAMDQQKAEANSELQGPDSELDEDPIVCTPEPDEELTDEQKDDIVRELLATPHGGLKLATELQLGVHVDGDTRLRTRAAFMDFFPEVYLDDVSGNRRPGWKYLKDLVSRENWEKLGQLGEEPKTWEGEVMKWIR